MTILAIDPGMKGGLALRSDKWVIVEPMFTDGKDIDLITLRSWIEAHRDVIDVALIELAGIRPKQSIQDCAKQWRIFGELKGLLAGMRIPYRVVNSRSWSAMFQHGVTETEKHARYRAIKAARKRIVGELFPSVDLRESSRCTTPHEGMTDALLLAEYGHRTTHRGNV